MSQGQTESAVSTMHVRRGRILLRRLDRTLATRSRQGAAISRGCAAGRAIERRTSIGVTDAS